jgi:hypothetical protein
MKKYWVAIFICLAAIKGFSQERTVEKTVAPKPVEATVATDSASADKPFLVTSSRKKKSKSARNKKECSRMKS